MTEMFGEAWPPMSVPDLAPDDDDDLLLLEFKSMLLKFIIFYFYLFVSFI